MTQARWDPFRNIAALQDRINRVFDDSVAKVGDLYADTACTWKPPVDIYETDDGIVITAEVPGVRKEDLSVELRENVLTLKGRRLADSEIPGDRYLRKERCFGPFCRVFTLQYRVRPEKVSAKFKDGVLEVYVPGTEADRPRQVNIEVAE